MSPLHRLALDLADAELERRRALHALSAEDRAAVERLATAIAAGVAGAVEAAAAADPTLARALTGVYEG
jgi:hypothetical protein